MGIIEKIDKRLEEQEDPLWRQILIGTTIIGILAMLSGLFIDKCLKGEYQKKYLDFYHHTQIKADTNYDGITSKEEWEEVYKELGIQFDEISSKPYKDFSISQLEQYVNKRRK